MLRWVLNLIGFELKKIKIAQLPIFYVVIENPGVGDLPHEATRSIHRARGIAREMRANGKNVAVATYTADSITFEV